MAEAFWKETLIAVSEDIVTLEGNQYFPVDSLRKQHFRSSDHTTVCPWKGTANYYDVVVGDEVNTGAAWYYAEPKPDAENIRGRVAFWKGVEIR